MMFKEPTLRVGFIIFRYGMEEEIPIYRAKGHWATAKKWVFDHGLQDLFNRVAEKDQRLSQYDDFLTDYIGAIRLHTVGGVFKCYIPRFMNNANKSFLKRYYRHLGYEIYGDVSCDEVERSIKLLVPLNYGKTLVESKTFNGEKFYTYNPYRIGD